MQKIAIGILAVLGLFLAGMNSRLLDREKTLSQRVADLEARARRKAPARAATAPAPEPVAETPLAAAEPQPEAPKAQTPPPAPTSAPIVDALAGQAQAFIARVRKEVGTALPPEGVVTFTLKATTKEIENVDSDAALGLTPSQKVAIDALRKERDARTKEFEDRIAKATDDTEQQIRGMLTPEQLAKYDAERSPSQDTIVQTTEELTADGRKPGYLGINGGDAEGGGAKVTQVMPNTAASALGLQTNDVILEFNGLPVASLSDLATKIRGAGEGAPANLKIRRNGTDFYQGLQLGGWPK